MKLSSLLPILLSLLSVTAWGQKSTNVNTVDELLKAIAPNKVIRLKANKIILSNANKNISNPYVSIDPVDDGLQLVIKDVKNLRIEGSSSRKSKLLSNSLMAPVIRFENCEDIALDNVEIGHSPGTYTPEGVIVAFADSKRMTLTNCILLGGGTQGLTLYNCTDGRFDNLTIRGCSRGIMTLKNTSGVSFINSRFTGNQQFDLITVTDAEKITFENCLIDLNKTGDGAVHNTYALFNAPLTPSMYDPIITLTKCTIEDNQCQYFCRSGTAIKLEDCKLDNNIFEKGYNSHK